MISQNVEAAPHCDVHCCSVISMKNGFKWCEHTKHLRNGLVILEIASWKLKKSSTTTTVRQTPVDWVILDNIIISKSRVDAKEHKHSLSNMQIQSNQPPVFGLNCDQFHHSIPWYDGNLASPVIISYPFKENTSTNVWRQNIPLDNTAVHSKQGYVSHMTGVGKALAKFIFNWSNATQGRNRHIFLSGQSHFSWFFSWHEMLFPSRKCPFWYTKQISIFKSEKQKKKKKKKSSPLFFCNFSYFHFQFSTFSFTIFLLFSSIFTPFPFFPCLFFPDTSAKISWSEVSGGNSVPPPSPSPVTSLMQLNFILKLSIVWGTEGRGTQIFSVWMSSWKFNSHPITMPKTKQIYNLYSTKFLC